jgi:hypothetical protein
MALASNLKPPGTPQDDPDWIPPPGTVQPPPASTTPPPVPRLPGDAPPPAGWVPPPGSTTPVPVIPGEQPRPAPPPIATPLPPAPSVPAPGPSVQPGTWTPNIRPVDEATETIEGRLARLFRSDSPLLQQAQTRAAEQANARGLLNSSLANSAALAALTEAALPIATGDAATYSRARELGTQIENEAGRFNVASANEFRGREQAAQLQAQTMAVASQLDTQSRERLLAIENNYRGLAEANTTARGMVVNLNNQIAAILADPNIDITNKPQLINRLIFSAQESLQVLGAMSGVDFGGLLDFSQIYAGFPQTPPPGPPQPTPPPPPTPPPYVPDQP